MSKAFLPEDSAAPEEPTLPSRPPGRHPITAAGHRRLLAERAAIDPNDAAMKTRSLSLDRILSSVEIIEPTIVDGRASFGSVIEIEDEHGKRRIYQLVGMDEIDASAGRISTESPLGRALLGKRAGESFEIERAGRVDELVVIDVRPQ